MACNTLTLSDEPDPDMHEASFWDCIMYYCLFKKEEEVAFNSVHVANALLSHWCVPPSSGVSISHLSKKYRKVDLLDHTVFLVVQSLNNITYRLQGGPLLDLLVNELWDRICLYLLLS